MKSFIFLPCLLLNAFYISEPTPEHSKKLSEFMEIAFWWANS